LQQIETFGPNEPEKFHEMGEPHVKHFHETSLFHIVCTNSMYSKGNEQVLGKEQVLEKENKILELFFVLILDVSEQREFIFVFSPGNEFLFLLYV
jgi:hypothetical protein